MCREWIQLLKSPPCCLNEPSLGLLRRAGWDSAQQNTSKTLSEILLFPCKPEIKLFENNWHPWMGQFPGSMKSTFFHHILSPPQAIHSADNHHRWIHNVIIGKGVGTSMYTTNQMCPIDQTSFSCIFLAAILNSNNYFRKELSDSYPGDSKPSSFSEQISIYGGCVCVKSWALMTVLKMPAGHGQALAGQGRELTWQRGAIKC